MPVRKVQFWNGGLWRQRRRINDPRVRNKFLESTKKALAQLLPPETVQIAIPKQREQHLLLEHWLRRRCEANSFVSSQFKNLFRVRHVGQVEQFKKAIHRVAICKIVES